MQNGREVRWVSDDIQDANLGLRKLFRNTTSNIISFFHIRSFSLLLQCPFPDWVRIFRAGYPPKFHIYRDFNRKRTKWCKTVLFCQHNHLFAMTSEGSGYLNRTAHLNWKPQKECSFNWKVLTLLGVGCWKLKTSRLLFIRQRYKSLSIPEACRRRLNIHWCERKHPLNCQFCLLRLATPVVFLQSTAEMRH